MVGVPVRSAGMVNQVPQSKGARIFVRVYYFIKFVLELFWNNSSKKMKEN